MATLRVIHTDRSNPDRLHMFGNLAEDIARAFWDNPRVEADLEAVDKGSDTLVLQVRTGLKGRALQTIRRLIAAHMMTADVRVNEA